MERGRVRERVDRGTGRGVEKGSEQEMVIESRGVREGGKGRERGNIKGLI